MRRAGTRWGWHYTAALLRLHPAAPGRKAGRKARAWAAARAAAGGSPRGAAGSQGCRGLMGWAERGRRERLPGRDEVRDAGGGMAGMLRGSVAGMLEAAWQECGQRRGRDAGGSK